jgi:uncharacterized protein YoxC
MNFLDRNTLPKFQERLDLAASELNDMEEIIAKAINELAGRIYIITNLVPLEERDKYAQENSFLILNTMSNIQTALSTLEERFEALLTEKTNELEEINNKLKDLDSRLNALDDVAARKADLNVVLYRTGELE